MKRKNFTIFCMAFLFCLEGCMGKADKLAVRIQDGLTETRLDVKEGITVANVLENAEILLDTEDTVTPSLDTKVTEDGTDISINRSGDINDVIENESTGENKEDDTSIDTDKEDIPKGTAKQADENESASEEPEIISKEKVYDCDGSGHGYYYIKWSDGREEYEDF